MGAMEGFDPVTATSDLVPRGVLRVDPKPPEFRGSVATFAIIAAKGQDRRQPHEGRFRTAATMASGRSS